jgi:hypothetical protein
MKTISHICTFVNNILINNCQFQNKHSCDDIKKWHIRCRAFPDGCHLFQEDWNYFVYRKGFKNTTDTTTTTTTNKRGNSSSKSQEVTRVCFYVSSHCETDLRVLKQIQWHVFLILFQVQTRRIQIQRRLWVVGGGSISVPHFLFFIHFVFRLKISRFLFLFHSFSTSWFDEFLFVLTLWLFLRLCVCMIVRAVKWNLQNLEEDTNKLHCWFSHPIRIVFHYFNVFYSSLFISKTKFSSNQHLQLWKCPSFKRSMKLSTIPTQNSSLRSFSLSPHNFIHSLFVMLFGPLVLEL